MRLSRATQYAILSMAQLKPDGEPVPCSTLAKLGDMPDRFLLQVLRNLTTAELVKSTRGINGGYRLARPATDISLLDIIEAIEGGYIEEKPEVLVGSLSKKASTAVVDALAKSAKVQASHLSSVKLSSLCV